MAGTLPRRGGAACLGALLLCLASRALALAPIEIQPIDGGLHRAPDGRLLIRIAVHNPAPEPREVDVAVDTGVVTRRLTLPGLARRDLLLFTLLEHGPVTVVARTSDGLETRLPPLPLPPTPPSRTCAWTGAGTPPTDLPAGWQAVRLPDLPDRWAPYLAYPVWLVEEGRLVRAPEAVRTAMATAAQAGARIVPVPTRGHVHFPAVGDPRPLLPPPTPPRTQAPDALATALTRAALWQGVGALFLATVAATRPTIRRTLALAAVAVAATAVATPLIHPPPTVACTYITTSGGTLEEATAEVSGGTKDRRLAVPGDPWLPTAASPGLRWLETDAGLVLEQRRRLAGPAIAHALAVATTPAAPRFAEVGRGH